MTLEDTRTLSPVGEDVAGLAQRLERQVPNVLSRLPYNRRSQRDIRAALDDLSGR